MDKFLPQCAGGFEVNQDMLFIKDPPEFLRCACDIRNYDNVTFSRLLISVCSGSLSYFDKGSVWIVTHSKCSPEVLLFHQLPL